MLTLATALPRVFRLEGRGVARPLPKLIRHFESRLADPASLNFDVIRGMVRVRVIADALQCDLVPLAAFRSKCQASRYLAYFCPLRLLAGEKLCVVRRVTALYPDTHLKEVASNLPRTYQCTQTR